MGFTDFFKSIGSGLKKVFGFAQDHGLTDEVIQIAETYVSQAALNQSLTSDQKRQFVVDALVKVTGVSRSIAGLALELALQAFKSKQL